MGHNLPQQNTDRGTLYALRQTPAHDNPHTHLGNHTVNQVNLTVSLMEKPKYQENTQTTKHMPTKKQIQQELEELKQTITDTITLIQTLQEKPDYTTIRQLNWHLGWHQGIYHTEILEDPHYDTQALHLTQKILKQLTEN